MAIAPRSVPQQEERARPRRRPAGNGRNFLADVVIEHGPAPTLSRLFLNADTRLRSSGFNLTFVDFDELLEINRANAASWHPLVPVFDPVIGGVNGLNGMALVARNAAGRPIAAIASRHYPLTDCSLKDELESLRLFYQHPMDAIGRGERMIVSAPSASSLRGHLVYTGGVWVHPDFRSAGVHRMISPISRGLSFTRWNSDACFSLMVAENITTGVARRARFLHTEWGAQWTNSPVFGAGTLELALVWTTRDEQLQHFNEYVAALERPASEREEPEERKTVS